MIVKHGDKTESIVQEAEGLWPDKVIPWGETVKLANRYGVTRQWVQHVLSKAGFTAKAGKRAYYGFCTTCGRPMRDRQVRQPDEVAQCAVCRQQPVAATCAVCGVVWMANRSALAARQKRSKTGGLLFCSRACWGAYVGRTWGRGKQKQGGEASAQESQGSGSSLHGS